LTFKERINKLAQAVRNPLFIMPLFGGFMGLKNLIGSSSVIRYSLFLILVVFVFSFIGCGEVEETTMEQPQAKAVKPGEAPVAQQPAKAESTEDQVLTSFIGSEPEQPMEVIAPAPSVSKVQLAQYEKQIDDLRTENTSLKQNIVKLEQENRTINARLTELDAKYASEKFRADSTEGLVKTSSLASKPVKMTSDEEGVYPPSQSTYDNAMKAFRARSYDSALKGFKAIVDGGGEDELVGRSMYWLGETYFAKKKYNEALPLFQDVLKQKGSEKKADAQFMIGRTYENLGSKTKAKAAYEKVVKNYPMSKNVKTAKKRWAKL
jgi:tol-pal system protein YbgF